MKTTRLGLAACAASLLCMGASVAIAGEITGNGKSLKNPDGTLNGKSSCAFSGREDTPGDPLFRGEIAQSWGQILKSVRDTLPAFLHPGVSCNPQRS
jgi:hypothetical protein